MDDLLIRPNPVFVKRQTESERNKLTDDQVRLLRRMAKTNLFFLAQTILGYNDLSKNLHAHLCTWLDKTKFDQYRLILLPRSHYKTTIATISDSIQLALPDDTGNLPYPHNLGPDIRIALWHEGAEHAAAFLESIANHVFGNPKLLALFPEIEPGKNHRANRHQLELPRSRFWGEPTFEAHGVRSRIQGRHYNVIKADDIYGPEARDSEATHKATIKFTSAIQSFLVTPKTDHIDFAGTRYRYDDVYSHIFKTYRDQLKWYVRPVWEPDESGELQPIFPEKFSMQSLKILQQDRANFESNYLNDPAAGMSEFEESWINYYERGREDTYVYFGGDEAKKWSLWEMDRVMLLDPATTGQSGIIVTGTTPERDFKVLVLEAIQEALPVEDFINKVFQLVSRYKPRLVVFEEVLFSVLFENIFQREMVRKGVRFRLEGARTKRQMKEDRVRGLVNWFANERILVHADQNELIKSIRRFPSLKDYHCLDALAYGPVYWRRSHGNEIVEKREDAIQKLLEGRNPVTGYSR